MFIELTNGSSKNLVNVDKVEYVVPLQEEGKETNRFSVVFYTLTGEFRSLVVDTKSYEILKKQLTYKDSVK